MTENEIKQETIARYLGLQADETGHYLGGDLNKVGIPFSLGSMGTGTNTLKFDTDSNWQDAVISKIESDGYYIDIATNAMSIHNSNAMELVVDFSNKDGKLSRKEMIFECLFDFCNHLEEEAKPKFLSVIDMLTKTFSENFKPVGLDIEELIRIEKEVKESHAIDFAEVVIAKWGMMPVSEGEIIALYDKTYGNVTRKPRTLGALARG